MSPEQLRQTGTRPASGDALAPSGFSVGRSGGMVTLELAREHAGNSIDRATGEELDRALAELEEDEELLCLIVGSQGDRFFCTGGDLKDYRALTTADSAQRTSRLMQRVLKRLEDMAAVTIAAINGIALGGGLELALACDIRIADERAELSLPQARLGVIPGWGGAHRLARTVGRSRALELLTTARTVPAEEGLALGLVDAVVPPGDALARSRQIAARVAESAPLAVRSMKRALDLGGDADALAELFGELWDSEDHREAERAYFEGRAPSWRGR